VQKNLRELVEYETGSTYKGILLSRFSNSLSRVVGDGRFKD
jgi:hypothetical protein